MFYSGFDKHQRQLFANSFMERQYVKAPAMTPEYLHK
jgi:hypothetical protein